MQYIDKTDRELAIDMHEMMTVIVAELIEMKKRDIEMNSKLNALGSRKGIIQEKRKYNKKEE